MNINNMVIMVIVMVELNQYVSVTGEQFGLWVVSQQVDGIGKGCCVMVRSKIKYDVIFKLILLDGIFYIIVLVLVVVY